MPNISLVFYLKETFLVDSPVNRLSVTITIVTIGNVASVVNRIQIGRDLSC